MINFRYVKIIVIFLIGLTISTFLLSGTCGLIFMERSNFYSIDQKIEQLYYSPLSFQIEQLYINQTIRSCFKLHDGIVFFPRKGIEKEQSKLA